MCQAADRYSTVAVAMFVNGYIVPYHAIYGNATFGTRLTELVSPALDRSANTPKTLRDANQP